MHSSQPLSTSAMTSQSHSTPWRHNSNTKNVTVSAREWDWIVLKSTDRRSNISLFLYYHGLIHGCLIVFISRVIRWNCFSKMWHISLPHILQNNDLQCWLKNGGGDRKRGLSRVHCICTMHCVQCTLEKQCTANHVINNNKKNDILVRITSRDVCLLPDGQIWTASKSIRPSISVNSTTCHIISVCSSVGIRWSRLIRTHSLEIIDV